MSWTGNTGSTRYSNVRVENSKIEMEAMDELPAKFRNLLKHCALNFSAVQLTELIELHGEEAMVDVMKKQQAKI